MACSLADWGLNIASPITEYGGRAPPYIPVLDFPA